LRVFHGGRRGDGGALGIGDAQLECGSISEIRRGAMLPHGRIAARISRSPGQLGVVGCGFESYLGSQKTSAYICSTCEGCPSADSNPGGTSLKTHHFRSQALEEVWSARSSPRRYRSLWRSSACVSQFRLYAELVRGS
jgi:hypothetical protein